MANKHIGSSFESFLDEQGITAEVHALAWKAIIADNVRKAMTRKKVTRTALATRMRASRDTVYRMLDPKNTGLTIETICAVANALGVPFETIITAKPRAPSRSKAA